MPQTETLGTRPMVYLLYIMLSCAALLFLPLLSAAMEVFITGSETHTDAICRQLGIMEFLNGIYRPVLKPFR